MRKVLVGLAAGFLLLASGIGASAKDQPAKSQAANCAQSTGTLQVDEKESSTDKGGKVEIEVESKDTAEAGSKNATKDDSKDTAKAGTKDETKDDSKDSAKAGAQVEAKDDSKDAAKTGAKDETKDESKDTAEATTKVTVKDKAETECSGASGSISNWQILTTSRDRELD